MDYQKMMDYRNTHGPFAARLGIRLTELGLGCAKAEKTITAEDLNPMHYPHGGIYFSLADTACGSAMATHGYTAVTLNAGYNFFHSAEVGDTLTASAVESKSGKTVCVYDVQVTDQRGTLLGTGTFTFFRLEEKIQL